MSAASRRALAAGLGGAALRFERAFVTSSLCSPSRAHRAEHPDRPFALYLSHKNVH